MPNKASLDTLPETNIDLENWWLEDACPNGMTYLQSLVSLSRENDSQLDMPQTCFIL